MGHLNVIQSCQLSKYLRKAYLAKYVKSVRSLQAPSIREVEWRSRFYHRWADGGPTVEYRLRPATHIQRRPDGGPTVEYRLRPATHIQRRPHVALGAIWVIVTIHGVGLPMFVGVGASSWELGIASFWRSWLHSGGGCVWSCSLVLHCWWNAEELCASCEPPPPTPPPPPPYVGGVYGSSLMFMLSGGSCVWDIEFTIHEWGSVVKWWMSHQNMDGAYVVASWVVPSCGTWRYVLQQIVCWNHVLQPTAMQCVYNHSSICT